MGGICFICWKSMIIQNQMDKYAVINVLEE